VNTLRAMPTRSLEPPSYFSILIVRVVVAP
jgi:hypothetical protein